MLSLKWEERFSVNVKELDRQHTSLIEMLNQCNTLMNTEHSNRDVLTIVHKLILYARNHFTLEEQFMKEAGYNKLEEHKKEHEHFKSIVTCFEDQYKKGQPLLISNIMEFLMDWFVEHLLISDKKYIETLNKAGIK